MPMRHDPEGHQARRGFTARKTRHSPCVWCCGYQPQTLTKGATLMIGLLRGFAYAWMAVLLLVVGASFTSFLRASDSVLEALNKMTASFDPFNTSNTILIIVLVLPAFG